MFTSAFKILIKTVAIIALLASGASPVAAQRSDSYGPKVSIAGKWVIGAKVANIDPNDENIRDSRGAGIVLGYEFDKEILGGKSAFELEYISGEEEDFNSGFIGTYEADVLNAFFSYRTGGNVFFKIKGGLSYVDIETSVPFFDDDFEDVSLAVGVGVGYRFNDYGIIEIEYSQDSGDSDLGILGLNGLLTF